MSIGLSKNEVQRKLREKINEDPDLKYYVEDEYITKIIDLLIEGIGEVIEKNNETVFGKLIK